MANAIYGRIQTDYLVKDDEIAEMLAAKYPDLIFFDRGTRTLIFWLSPSDLWSTKILQELAFYEQPSCKLLGPNHPLRDPGYVSKIHGNHGILFP